MGGLRDEGFEQGGDLLLLLRGRRQAASNNCPCDPLLLSPFILLDHAPEIQQSWTASAETV
jgi:hypothetical protein